MNLSPESVKKTLLNKVNELSASKTELLSISTLTLLHQQRLL